MNYSLLLSCVLLFTIMITGCQAFDGKSVSPSIHLPDPVVVDDTNVRRRHVSTRPHNRKVLYHAPSGYWYVFYGHGDRDPDGRHRISWRSSKDGVNWSKPHTAFEGNSHSSSVDVLLTGDKITMLVFRPHYYREKAGIPEFRNGKPWYDRPEEDFPLPYEIRQYEIKEGDLIPGPIFPVMGGTAFDGRPHYGSLTQDTEGFFWVGARAITDGGSKPFQVWVARSLRAGDVSEWKPHTVLFKTSRHGSISVQVIALDHGKVFAVIFSKGHVKIYGSLYDPVKGKWEQPYVIAEGNAESKRPVASFDPGAKRLHLVGVDNSGALRHKILYSPYRRQDWIPKAGRKVSGTLIVSDIRTRPEMDNNISLSIDTSKSPAPLIVAYHKKTPHYRLRRYSGRQWEDEDYPVGIQDRRRYADEISLIRDYSSRLGLIYYVLPSGRQKGELHFLDIPKDIFQDTKQ